MVVKKTIRSAVILTLACLHAYLLYAQSPDSTSVNKSKNRSGKNVFTSGLFMAKGQFEVKMFNNLYTEVVPYNDNFNKRSSFFTSFLQLTIGSNRNINYGLDLLYKSNVMDDLAGNSPFKVLYFDKKSEANMQQGEQITTIFNHGLSHIGGRIRVKPFKEKRFTFQQAVYIPAGNIDGGWVINSNLFFEYLNARKKFMLFGDLGVWYNTRQLPFPYLKVFGGTLIAKRLGPYIMFNLPYEIGSGLKIFVLPKMELEFLYTWWLPLEWTVQDRRPQTFNIGLRFANFRNFERR